MRDDKKELELQFADGKKMKISEEVGVVVAAHIA